MVLKLNILPDSLDKWYPISHPTYLKAVRNEDCGLDIPMLFTVIVPAKSKAYTVDLGIKTEPTHAYMLVPRSSICKTPLRLANSIGIIDKSYRGKLLVKVDNNSNKDFEMEVDKCYFQIIAFDGNLPEYTLVKEISKTKRGAGGFGSTDVDTSLEWNHDIVEPPVTFFN